MQAIETHMKNENRMVKILMLYQDVNYTIVLNNSTVDESYLIIIIYNKKKHYFFLVNRHKKYGIRQESHFSDFGDRPICFSKLEVVTGTKWTLSATN